MTKTWPRSMLSPIAFSPPFNYHDDDRDDDRDQKYDDDDEDDDQQSGDDDDVHDDAEQDDDMPSQRGHRDRRKQLSAVRTSRL